MLILRRRGLFLMMLGVEECLDALEDGLDL